MADSSASIWAPVGEQGPPGPIGPVGPIGPQGPIGGPGPDAATFLQFKTDLLNSTDPTKGTALVGGASRVVNTIAELIALPKTGTPRVFVLGYYAPSDGGGGIYWYDPTDTTSVSNGGTLIVATDGGRWKLATAHTVSLRQFGAKGDGVTDDTVRVKATIDAAAALGLHLYGPRGVYNINNTGVSVGNTGAGNTGGAQPITFLSSFHGDGASSTIFNFTGTTGTCFTVIQGGSASTSFKGFSVLQKSVTKQGVGLKISQTSWTAIEDVQANGFDIGISVDDCFSLDFRGVKSQNNNIGITGDYIFVSRPNDITFTACNFTNNVKYGGTFSSPTTLNFFGGSIEGNGGVAGEGGLRIYGNPVDGIAGLSMYGTYCEGNGGSFDVGIYDVNGTPGIHNIQNITFNRINNVKFTSANIAFYKTTAAQTKIRVDGCGFQGFNSYVPSASRIYIQVPVPFDSNYLIDLGTNIFGSAVETPNLPGAYTQNSRVSAALRFNGVTATVTGVSVNIASITKQGTGWWTITFAKRLKTGNNVYSVGVCETAAIPELFSESDTTFTFKLRNLAGAYTDYTNISVMVYGFDGAA